MDKRKGLLNVGVAIAFKVLILISGILVRRFLIRYLGNDINGLNSLYASLLDFLAVAELGVGTAITFCMYKPIIDGNNVKVSALYGLFTKLYLIIGGIILICGCAIMPALPYLAKDYTTDINIYLTFGLTLISVVVSYVFSSKTSLINAYKNNYLTTTISSVCNLLQCIAQAVVIILTKSFIGYIVCRIIAMLLQWIITELFARKKYKEVITNKIKPDSETKKEVTKNIKAMFMHKIGYAFVNTADSLIISAFIGVVVLGKYSNYTSIIIAMVSVISLCFTPLTSVIGHMCVEDDCIQIRKYFNFFHTFNFIIGLVFFLGYYAVINNLIAILFADNLALAKSVPIIITVNYFIQFMEQSVRLFKDASGMFYYDRWKCVFEAALNIGLSILFVFIFPADYKVVGVIVATIITNLFICHIIEPLVLYKHTLRYRVKEYYIRNYAYIALFVGLVFTLHFSMIKSDNQWIELFANGGISLAYSLGVSTVVILLNKNFRQHIVALLQRIKNHLSKTPVAQRNNNNEAESIVNQQQNDSIGQDSNDIETN